MCNTSFGFERNLRCISENSFKSRTVYSLAFTAIKSIMSAINFLCFLTKLFVNV